MLGPKPASRQSCIKIGRYRLDPLRNSIAGDGIETTLEPKIVDVLLSLASRPGEVITREELIAAVWKTKFGGDESLTRAISKLRKVLKGDQSEPEYLKTIPKRGYLLTAPVEFETAKSDKSHIGAFDKEKMRGPDFRTIVVGLAIITIGAVAYFGGNFTKQQSGDSVGGQVIVEPFIIGRNAPMTDALASSTLATLSQILVSNQISVAPAEFSRRNEEAAGNSGPNPEFSVSGFIEHIEDTADHSLTLYFSNRRPEEVLWSHQFAINDADEERSKVSLALKAASIINCGLQRRRETSGKIDNVTFKLLLEICDIINTGDRLPELLEASRALVRLNPSEPTAHGILALAHAFVPIGFTLTDEERSEHLQMTEESAARALSIDPKETTAPLALALARRNGRNWEILEQYLDSADVENAFCPCALELYIFFLRETGRLSEAENFARIAAARNPLSPTVQALIGLLTNARGEYEQADRLFEKLVTEWPDSATGAWYSFVNLALYRDPSMGLDYLEQTNLVTKDLGVEGRNCYLVFLRARKFEAGFGSNEVLDACADIEGYLVRQLAILGDVEAAYSVAEKMTFGSQGSTIFLFTPELQQFRFDMRFLSIIAKSGLPDYWVSSQKLPDFCSDPNLPYDCKEVFASMIQK